MENFYQKILEEPNCSGETTRQPTSMSKVTMLRVGSPLEPWRIKKMAGEYKIESFFY